MNWMNTKEFSPPSDINVIVCIKDEMFIGKFTTSGRYFFPSIGINHPSCEVCPENLNIENGFEYLLHCGDCLEKEYEISHLYKEFNLTEVDYWMPLPENPKYV